MSKSLEQYREEHKQLKDALKDFEKNLPKDFVLNQLGVIVENKKYLIGNVELKTKEYLGGSDKNYEISEMNFTVKFDDISNYMYDYMYCVLGLYNKFRDKFSPDYSNLTSYNGLDFTTFNTDNLKFQKAKEHFKLYKTQTSFVDLYKFLVCELFIGSKGLSHIQSVVFSDQFTDKFIVNSLDFELDVFFSILDEYQRLESLKEIFEDVNGGYISLDLDFEIDEDDYEDYHGYGAITIVVGNEEFFQKLKKDEISRSKLI